MFRAWTGKEVGWSYEITLYLFCLRVTLTKNYKSRGPNEEINVIFKKIS